MGQFLKSIIINNFKHFLAHFRKIVQKGIFLRKCTFYDKNSTLDGACHGKMESTNSVTRNLCAGSPASLSRIYK